MAVIEGDSFSTASGDTASRLTKVMVLHPIVCGIAFLAFLTSLGAGVRGSLLASLISALAWLLSVVVLAMDFVLFGIVRYNVNTDFTDSVANYSAGMWTMVVAMICLFFATFIVFFSCCSTHMHRRSDRNSKADSTYAPDASQRRFWQRGAAY
jgi:uncharacterized membrane protein